MTLHTAHSALAVAAWGIGTLIVIAAAVAFRDEAVYAWRRRKARRAMFDDALLAQRLPGEGRLHLVADDDEVYANPYAALAPERIDALDPAAPVYSDLADERPEAVESMDEARLRRP